MAEKIIKVSSFPYRGEDGIERTALRGDTADITDEADLERGDRLGVFATAADLKEGTVFGDFYVGQLEWQAGKGDSEPVVTQPDPAATVEKPAASASRKDWAAYAASKGAPAGETAEQGGLNRDQLRDKYGS